MQETCFSNADKTFLNKQFSSKVPATPVARNLALGNPKSLLKASTALHVHKVGGTIQDIVFQSTIARVTSFLQSSSKDDIVVHYDSTSQCVQRRLEESNEKKGFVAVDVGSIIKRWSVIVTSLPNVKPVIHSGFTGDETLCALMIRLGSKVCFQSSSDITSTHRALLKASAMQADNECESNETVFEDSTFDMCVTRSPSALTASLKSGCKTFAVTSVTDMKLVMKRAGALGYSGLKFMVLLSLDSSVGKEDECGLRLGSCLAEGSCALPQLSHLVEYHDKHSEAVSSRICGYSISFDELLNESSVTQLCALLGDSEGMCLYLRNVPEATTKDHKMLAVVRERLETLQSCVDELAIFADFTSCLVGNSHQLFAHVIGTRPSIDRGTGEVVGNQVFVDDGIYGCLCNPNTAHVGDVPFSVGFNEQDKNCIVPVTVNHLRYDPCTNSQDAERERGSTSMCTTIWGQTCDSLDKVGVCDNLPTSIVRGDWIRFNVTHGSSASTAFNGYDVTRTKYFVQDVSSHPPVESKVPLQVDVRLATVQEADRGQAASPPSVSSDFSPPFSNRVRKHPQRYMHASVKKDRSLLVPVASHTPSSVSAAYYGVVAKKVHASRSLHLPHPLVDFRSNIDVLEQNYHFSLSSAITA